MGDDRQAFKAAVSQSLSGVRAKKPTAGAGALDAAGETLDTDTDKRTDALDADSAGARVGRRSAAEMDGVAAELSNLVTRFRI